MSGQGRSFEWWVAITEGVEGPLSRADVFEAVRMGRVQPNTLVRRGTDGAWGQAVDVFPGAFGTQGPEASSNPSRTAATSDGTTASGVWNKVTVSGDPEARRNLLIVGSSAAGVLLLGIIWTLVGGSGQSKFERQWANASAGERAAICQSYYRLGPDTFFLFSKGFNPAEKKEINRILRRSCL